MTLLSALGGSLGAIVTGLLIYFGNKALRASQARKGNAEADLSAVSGYDLLTKSLTARLTEVETKLKAVEDERDAYRGRLAHAESEAEAAKVEAAACRREVARLTAIVEAS